MSLRARRDDDDVFIPTLALYWPILCRRAKHENILSVC